MSTQSTRIIFSKNYFLKYFNSLRNIIIIYKIPVRYKGPEKFKSLTTQEICIEFTFYLYFYI